MPDDSVLLGQLAEEFSAKARQGLMPDIEAYAQKHPGLAERIRALFPTLLLLEGMAGGSAPLSPYGRGVGGEGHLQPGVTFGNFRIEREIGRGGMGVVFEATHQALGKRVALKILPVQGPCDASNLERFLREAQTAAGLHHTNIVPVFDVGQVSGIPYYAMQYIEGRGLDQVMRDDEGVKGRKSEGVNEEAPTIADPNTSLPFRARAESPLAQPQSGTTYFRWIAEVGIQASEGLAHAHERGVVHRDIKPSNLILDDRGVVWITDFGLARRSADPALTHSGAILGTPRYMSPEQAEAAKKLVDHRTDVYSLGATLYELVTRRPAFDGPTPLDIVLQIIERQPVSPRRLNPALPRDLETVIMKAMAKRPEDRYQTAAELAEDLRRWLKMEPIRARRIGPVGKLARWGQRNPVVATLTASVFIVLLVGIAVSAHFAVEADNKAVDAVNAAATASDEAKRADKERDFALSQQKRAEGESERARQNEKTAWRNLYIANMNQVQQAWQKGRLQQVDGLLESQLPNQTGGHDFRDFEWHYFQRISHSGYKTVTEHKSLIVGVAYSPDGKWLASVDFQRNSLGAPEGEVIIRRTDSGEIKQRISNHVGGAYALAFSPDSSKLAVAAYHWDSWANPAKKADGSLTVYDVATGVPVARLAGQITVAFHPDGKRIATMKIPFDGPHRKSVVIWDWTTGKLTCEISLPDTSGVLRLALNRDGTRLAVAGYSLGEGNRNSVRLFDPKDGKQVLAIEQERGIIGLCFTPDAKWLATGGDDLAIRVWNAETGTLRSTLHGHSARIVALAFNHDGSRLASSSWDQTIRIWDPSLASQLKVFRGHRGIALGVSYHPDGSHLASAGGREVNVWNPDSEQDRMMLEKRKFPPRRLRAYGGAGLVFMPDNERVAFGRGGGVWSIQNGQQVSSLLSVGEIIRGGVVSAIAVSADGYHLATISHDSSVPFQSLRVRDLKTNRILPETQLHPEVTHVLAFSPHGKWLAVKNHRSLKVLDGRTGKEVYELLENLDFTLGGREPVKHTLKVEFSSDGTYLGVLDTLSNKSNVFTVWDTATWKLIHTFSSEPSPRTFAFHENGQQLAVAYDDQVDLWEVATWRRVHRASISCGILTAFNPKLTRLATTRATAGVDNEITIFDVLSGQHVATFATDTEKPAHLVFSPNGQRLAAAIENGFENSWYIQIWDARPLAK